MLAKTWMKKWKELWYAITTKKKKDLLWRAKTAIEAPKTATKGKFDL